MIQIIKFQVTLYRYTYMWQVQHKACHISRWEDPNLDELPDSDPYAEVRRSWSTIDMKKT